MTSGRRTPTTTSPSSENGDGLKPIELSAFGAPEALVAAWDAAIDELTPVQEQAVRAGVLDGKTNLLVVAPTSSGKTLVGEMAATVSAYTRRRHAIFIVPYKAVAEEHYELFRERYGELLSVVIATGDASESDEDIRLGNFNLAVMTYEKLTAFLVQQPTLLDRCTALVVDEVQSLGDPSRGANLETLLTQVLIHPSAPQLVALSASLDELNRLDDWLRAKLVIANERPVPLREGVLSAGTGTAHWRDEHQVVEERLLAPEPDRELALASLCERLVAEGKQVLVFRSVVRTTVETAKRLKRYLPAPGLPPEVAAELAELEPSEAVDDLRLTLASLVGYHNADLTSHERHLVEQAFRRGDARVLVATATLAMGVNLPSDVVVIADSTRPRKTPRGWTDEDISVADYKNEAGRAGRLGKRSAGTALLLADYDAQRRQLFEFYCRGTVEPVESQIPKEPFADVIFSVICAGLASDAAGSVEFIASTFAYQNFYEPVGGGLTAIRDGVEQAVRTCVESELVTEEHGVLQPTAVGRIFAGQRISLASASRLAELLEMLPARNVASEEVAYEVALCGESGDRPYLETRYGVFVDPRPSLGLKHEHLPVDSRLREALRRGQTSEREAQALAKAVCLLAWAAGVPERRIGARFRGCAPSRIRSLGKNAAWLLEALGAAAEARGLDEELVGRLRELATEMRYGLPAPLAPLARLNVRGIARATLARLHENEKGVRLSDPDDLLDASDDELDGLLTPTQALRLKAAIVAERGETLRRKQAGHLARAEERGFKVRLVEELYTAGGAALEVAVTDSLRAVGVTATRVVKQPRGEEDIQIATPSGTVVVSVTASQTEGKLVSWAKAKEVLGTGTGINPVNYACVARPGFHAVAEEKAAEIARERGGRKLLLIPLDVLAEAILRCSEERMTADDLGNMLSNYSGLVRLDDLPDRDREQAADAASAGRPPE